MPKKKNHQIQARGNKNKKKKKAAKDKDKEKDKKEEKAQEEGEKEKGEEGGNGMGKKEEEQDGEIVLKPKGIFKIKTRLEMNKVRENEIGVIEEEEEEEEEEEIVIANSLVFEASKSPTKMFPESRSSLSPDAKPFFMRTASSYSSLFKCTVTRNMDMEYKGIAKSFQRMDINKNDIIPGPVMKHPLSHAWTLWWFTGGKKSWLESLVQVMSFETVEDFWSLYHHVVLPSELGPGQDYFLFKKGIKPMWEDKANQNGGSWKYAQERKHRSENLDKRWLELSLLAIGENYGDYGAEEEVRGRGQNS